MGDSLQGLLEKASNLWIALYDRDRNNSLLHYGNSTWDYDKDKEVVTFNNRALQNHYLAVARGEEKVLVKYCTELAEEVLSYDVQSYLEQAVGLNIILTTRNPKHPLTKMLTLDANGRFQFIDVDEIQKYAEISNSDFLNESKTLTLLKAYCVLVREEIARPLDKQLPPKKNKTRTSYKKLKNSAISIVKKTDTGQK